MSSAADAAWLSRGACRSPQDQSRTFRPNYLSFAGTFQCNLRCPHCCVPIEWTDRLDIPTALRFLEQAWDAGITTLGFTGGEPFLYPEFLVALTRRGADLGFRFDKLMTNGVWYRDEDQLTTVMTQLREAGFDGKIGLSVDKFHGFEISRLALFCRVTRKVFDRDTILSLSYASRTPDQGLEPIERLARELDGVIAWSDMLGRRLLVSDDFTMTLNWNHLATVERAEQLPGNPWDGTWFEEDYCEGPGQALIVNPRGEVKPCCGFASDLDQLTIGNIHTDSVEQVIAAGRVHPVVGKIFREGLTALRDDILARDPNALPGATSNHCYFCWYALNEGLVQAPTPSGRITLGLTSSPEETRVWMQFDGRAVYLSHDGVQPNWPSKGRPYIIRITGRDPGSIPEKLTWDNYQMWIDRLREEGATLTTHAPTPCRQ